MEGAVFALLGLLTAFAFSGAGARFDSRRALVVEEANHIGTAWLRLDLLPPETQPPLRDLFRGYVDSRIDAYAKLPDVAAALAELDRSTKLQGEIWTRAVAASEAGGKPAATTLVLSALNQMVDITTTRTWAARTHPPGITFVMLAFSALAGALMAGFAMSEGKRSWVHVIGFSALMAATLYVIVDLEYPRAGFIRADEADQVLVDLRQSMN